jgi:histidine kinase/DNA gyrase B/HSP90-like ATPase
MIPNETPQTLATVGSTAVVGNFKITDATQARILVSLSDKMYTKKELAFVREYSTNAADAHIVAKKPIEEIIVELPTLENLNFRIRDFGSGLTEDQIANVYAVFGESTKRNSNEVNGMLGYGCKAGFAHADSFTVTSWINGEKSIYQCVKGDSQRLHSVVLLNRSASDEPTGIEVCIPVKQNSVWTVQQEAADFYKHWPTVPTIKNMTGNYADAMNRFRSQPATLKGEGWEIRPKSGGNATGVAYMGWVAYHLDWNVMFNRMSLTSQKRVLFDLLQSNDVTLHFKMGEVQFVDSREHLEYTDFTISALMTRIESIFSCIKDAIQEKFNTAGNMWEAKKLYNAIFGTGLIDVEKGEDMPSVSDRIKILDGNLTKLETVFLGEFTWNGVVLKGNGFDDINRFDNVTPSEVKGDKHNPIEPVMITYRKKKNRTKVNRCSAEKNNEIKANDFTVVVLNDTGKKSNQSLIARYMIFNDDADTNYRTVHILSFADSTIKDSFYSEYAFDTVPVVKMSEILADAKVWHSANKTSRTYGGGGGGSRPMQYMDLESGTIEEVEVPIRELEDGGFYVELGEGRRYCRRVQGENGYGYWDAGEFLKSLKTFVEAAGLDVDRVYMIPTSVRNAKWFAEAKQSGEWVSVWKTIKENVNASELGIDIQAYVDAQAYDACEVICKQAADKIVPHIREKNSYIFTVLSTVIAKSYTENKELLAALRSLGFINNLVGDTKPSLDYRQMKANMLLQYPMLAHYNYALENGCLDDDDTKEVVKYINAMDVYVVIFGEDDAKAEEAAKAATQPELVA